MAASALRADSTLSPTLTPNKISFYATICPNDELCFAESLTKIYPLIKVICLYDEAKLFFLSCE